MPSLHKNNASFQFDAQLGCHPFQLADELKLAALAIERTRVPAIITDPCQWDNPIALANAAFLNLSGYDSHDVQGRNCRVLQGDSTSPLAIAEMRSALNEGRDFAVTLLNYRKDGTAFWNELSVNHIHGSDGELSYYLAFQRSASQVGGAEESGKSEEAFATDESANQVLARVREIAVMTCQDIARNLPNRIDSCLAPLKWRQDVTAIQRDRRFF